jgi:hypothetical protein
MDNYLDLLRPPLAPEPCTCATLEEVELINQLTDNPLQCSKCRKAIDPERLSLSDEVIRSVAGWNSIVNALYLLWLDSTEYESYAKARLLDPRGHINQRGLDAARSLRSKMPTWFRFFHDADDELPENCPVCEEPLDANVERAKRRCNSCKLYI